MKRYLVHHIFILTGLLTVFSIIPLFPQAADILAKAQEAYDKDSFEKAYEIVDKGIPETADAAQKSQASSFLTTIGISEYNAKNWKNAFDAFRKALKYQPTNSLATQYFLKIRTEKGMANLKNEGEPRVKEKAASPQPRVIEPPVTTLPSPAQIPPVTAQSSPAPAPTPAPQPVLPQPTIELEEVKKALELTSNQLKNMEQTISTTSKENEILKAQIDQQLKLLQTFMEQQAKTPPSPEKSEAEKELVAKTMEVLAKLSVQEPKAPQVVLQQDPEIKTLVQQLAAKQKDSEKPSWITYSTTIALSLLAIGIIAIALFFFIMARKARTRSAQRTAQGAEPSISTLGAYTSQLNDQRSVPLLGFVGPERPEGSYSLDMEFLKELIHSDRIMQMVEEMRKGKLSWDIVRENVQELETSLKIEILKVVEKKLAEGDLVTPEAVLPILFPFINDFDTYIREKANLLAKKALLSDQKLLPAGNGEDSTPLSIKTLMAIPTQLAEVLRGLDQSLVTAKLSRSIGVTLGLSSEECNLLYKTAIAHDCGYLLLDKDRLQSIISKPEITEEEFEFIKQHTVKGVEYFQGIDLPPQFRAGILYHHERNDGSGYPEGLRKEQIPLFAKIIGVAETFATLIAKRPYRSKRDASQALAIIEDTAKTKFDSDIIQALSQVASSIVGR